jgi:hypothetical protein
MVCATVRIFMAIKNIQLKVCTLNQIFLSKTHFNILFRLYEVQNITPVIFIIKPLGGSAPADIIKCLPEDN